MLIETVALRILTAVRKAGGLRQERTPHRQAGRGEGRQDVDGKKSRVVRATTFISPSRITVRPQVTPVK